MFKLIESEYVGPKTKIKLFGITIASVKKDQFLTKYFLLGFRVFKKYNLRTMQKEISSLQDTNANLVNDTKQLKKAMQALNNENYFLKISAIKNSKNPILHMSAFDIGNVGDNILVFALQKSIAKVLGDVNFINLYLKKLAGEPDIHLFNLSKGIVIGGGGLFLKDSFPDSVSGWQFPLSTEQISMIESPMFMLAVGYNRFRGQDDFDPVFRENINALVNKCRFVGLRNTGSVTALRAYLDDDLKDKITVHPCATTIISKLYDLPNIKSEPFIAINCAFDRSEMRFGHKKDEILKALARVISKLSERYKIKYYAHMKKDLETLIYLDEIGIKYHVEELYRPYMIESKILQIYTSPQLVIGMRGHSLMIPFGCKTPILSLTSHEKQAWFLEDAGHPEWGVDVLESDFEDRLLDTANYILGHRDEVKKEISKAQDRFYDITVKNLKLIAGYMDL